MCNIPKNSKGLKGNYLGAKREFKDIKGKMVIYYRKNYRMDCRESPGAEVPKEINMVLISISRHDLWD